MAKVRTCRVCGCTDDRACDGGCWWLSDRDDLCSACEAAASHVISRTLEHVSANKSFSVAICRCGAWTRKAKRTQEAERKLDRDIRQHWQDVVGEAVRA